MRVKRAGDRTPDLEAIDVSPAVNGSTGQRTGGARRRHRLIMALGVFVAIGLLTTLVISEHHARRTVRGLTYCLSAPLSGRLTYTPATSSRTLGQLRGEVSGLPAHEYVEVALLARAAIPTRAYLGNGLPGPDVIGEVGFWTAGSASRRIAETLAVDRRAKVEEILFRVRSPLTRDLRPYGLAAQRC